MTSVPARSILCLLLAGFALACACTNPASAQSRLNHKPIRARSKKMTPPASQPGAQPEGEIIGRRVRFVDGSSLEVNEVWKQNEDFWYRLGGVIQRIDRPVASVDPIFAKPKQKSAEPAQQPAGNTENQAAIAQSFWVYLNGGARMKADEVNETDAGAWCRRGNLSIFIERERIARVERESAGRKPAGWRNRDWSTGNPRIDDLIRTNGARFGVDPYLVFCVIEHESHFHVRALSPKGARGLMQLMPGTASRFGVRHSFEPAENIYGGTQYLKELLAKFGGRLDLVLASYNAGEGAVIKYGGNVPPYRETRDYVKRVTQRYGADSSERISPPQ